MGHFTHNCKLTGLPIKKNATLIVMRLNNNLYDNSEESLRQYGKTSMVSNDGPRLKFCPVWFPIHGTYDDYGGLEDIIEDENTRLLEKYYSLTIQEIVDVVTCNRKDDGYSDSLKAVKDKRKKDEYNNPKYLDKYKELLSYSGMWIHGDVYKKITELPHIDDYDKLDLGTPQLLKHLGFKHLRTHNEPDDNRYNQVYEKDGLLVRSDGTWIKVSGNEGIYTLKQFKKYCEKNGITINIDDLINLTKVEQFCKLVVPTVKPINNDKIELFLRGIDNTLTYYFLNGKFNEYGIKNPMTPIYVKSAIDGKLNDIVGDFWKFDSYMYIMGVFYDIVGTAPQDGEFKEVKKVLEIALDVINEQINEYYDDDYDQDDV